MHAKASNELTCFARKYEIPVVHTLLGLGGFPPDDELSRDGRNAWFLHSEYGFI